MVHNGGDECFVFTVHSRVVVGVPAKTGGEPCGDTKGESVCLGCFKRAYVYIYCCKVLLCDCPVNTWESDISQIQLSGYY